jgi:esterase FrsA
MEENRCSALTIKPDLELYHSGPNLDSGEMPALFYFALSGPDSLCTDPYNQPVQFLAGSQIRVFSLTLPAHENTLSPQDAIGVWAEEIAAGKDPLASFLDSAQLAVEYAISQKLADPKRIAVAGLSRGGLFASLLAARMEQIHTVLGFAPLVRLNLAKEFHAHAQNPLVASYDISHAASKLGRKNLRFYIGNNDMRVNTRACFDCIEQIVKAAQEAGIRSPQTELILNPSVGHMGHGTPPEVFKQGALWIADHLKL